MLAAILSSVNLTKSYSISRLGNAVLCEVYAHARWHKTAHLIAAEILESLNGFETPGYVIFDLTHNMPGIEDLIIAFNSYVRGSRAWLRHPNLKEFVLVTQDTDKLSPSREMRKILLGDIPVRIFTQSDTALDFISQT